MDGRVSRVRGRKFFRMTRFLATTNDARNEDPAAKGRLARVNQVEAHGLAAAVSLHPRYDPRLALDYSGYA